MYSLFIICSTNYISHLAFRHIEQYTVWVLILFIFTKAKPDIYNTPHTKHTHWPVQQNY